MKEILAKIILLVVTYFFCSTQVFSQIGYKEKGIASFYSDMFHGKKTANGEKYNRNLMTCAHKQLPFGTLLRVKNLHNNKIVEVRVNDRGPFSPDKIVDVSKAAALELDILNSGIAQVEIEVIGIASAKQLKKGQEAKKTEPSDNLTASSSKEIAITKPSATNSNSKKEPVKVNSDSKAQSNSNVKPTEITSKDKIFKNAGFYLLNGKSAKPKGYGIQLGSFNEYEHVTELANKIKKAGYNTIYVLYKEPSKNSKKDTPKKIAKYTIILGNYDEKNIVKSIEEIGKKGLTGGFKIKYSEIFK